MISGSLLRSWWDDRFESAFHHPVKAPQGGGGQLVGGPRVSVAFFSQPGKECEIPGPRGGVSGGYWGGVYEGCYGEESWGGEGEGGGGGDAGRGGGGFDSSCGCCGVGGCMRLMGEYGRVPMKYLRFSCHV